MIVVQREANLPQVIRRLSPPRRLAGRLYSRQQQRHQDAAAKQQHHNGHDNGDSDSRAGCPRARRRINACAAANRWNRDWLATAGTRSALTGVLLIDRKLLAAVRAGIGNWHLLVLV